MRATAASATARRSPNVFAVLAGADRPSSWRDPDLRADAFPRAESERPYHLGPQIVNIAAYLAQVADVGADRHWRRIRCSRRRRRRGLRHRQHRRHVRARDATIASLTAAHPARPAQCRAATPRNSPSSVAVLQSVALPLPADGAARSLVQFVPAAAPVRARPRSRWSTAARPIRSRVPPSAPAADRRRTRRQSERDRIFQRVSQPLLHHAQRRRDRAARQAAVRGLATDRARVQRAMLPPVRRRAPSASAVSSTTISSASARTSTRHTASAASRRSRSSRLVARGSAQLFFASLPDASTATARPATGPGLSPLQQRHGRRAEPSLHGRSGGAPADDRPGLHPGGSRHRRGLVRAPVGRPHPLVGPRQADRRHGAFGPALPREVVVARRWLAEAYDACHSDVMTRG